MRKANLTRPSESRPFGAQGLSELLGEAHILCTSGRYREYPYKAPENSQLMGFKVSKSSRSSPAVLRQGCSIKSRTYSVFLPV